MRRPRPGRLLQPRCRSAPPRAPHAHGGRPRRRERHRRQRSRQRCCLWRVLQRPPRRRGEAVPIAQRGRGGCGRAASVQGEWVGRKGRSRGVHRAVSHTPASEHDPGWQPRPAHRAKRRCECRGPARPRPSCARLCVAQDVCGAAEELGAPGRRCHLVRVKSRREAPQLLREVALLRSLLRMSARASQQRGQCMEMNKGRRRTL